MSTHYSKVIDLIASGEVDYKAIAIKLAKASPSMFLRLHGDETAPTVTSKRLLSLSTLRDIRNSISSGNLISGIKTLREATATETNPRGLGLKEARDIIFVAAGREDNFLPKEFSAYVHEINYT